MTTASLELCKELYEVSGWYFGDHKWYHSEFNGLSTLAPADDDVGKTYKLICPAYDLGYLLRKLPLGREWRLYRGPTADMWCLYEFVPNDKNNEGLAAQADTPEDAACKLAIELFKSGVLTAPNPTNQNKKER